MIIVPLLHYTVVQALNYNSRKGFSYFILFGARYSDYPSLEYV